MWENIHTQVSRREAKRKAAHCTWSPINDHSKEICQPISLPASCPCQQASHKTTHHCSSQGCCSPVLHLQAIKISAYSNRSTPTAAEPLQKSSMAGICFNQTSGGSGWQGSQWTPFISEAKTQLPNTLGCSSEQMRTIHAPPVLTEPEGQHKLI